MWTLAPQKFPPLDFASLSQLEEWRLKSILWQIWKLQMIFHETWDSIPYSFELDRFELSYPGTYFALLEAGLISANVLPTPTTPLHGVVIDDILARKPLGPDSSIVLTHNADLARIETFHLHNRDAILIPCSVTAMRDCLQQLLKEITDYKLRVLSQMTRMDEFVQSTPTRREKITIGPTSLSLKSYAPDKLFVECSMQIARMRMDMKEVRDRARSRFAVEFTPLAELEEDKASWSLDVFMWNIMGAENIAFERSLTYVQQKFNPKLVVLSSTLAESSMVARAQAILGFGGFWVDERAEGQWIVWDSTLLEVHSYIGVNGFTTIVLARR